MGMICIIKCKHHKHNSVQGQADYINALNIYRQPNIKTQIIRPNNMQLSAGLFWISTVTCRENGFSHFAQSFTVAQGFQPGSLLIYPAAPFGTLTGGYCCTIWHTHSLCINHNHCPLFTVITITHTHRHIGSCWLLLGFLYSGSLGQLDPCLMHCPCTHSHIPFSYPFMHCSHSLPGTQDQQVLIGSWLEHRPDLRKGSNSGKYLSSHRSSHDLYGPAGRDD